eukprot:3623162-Pyramimonas_sp.AAC.1
MASARVPLTTSSGISPATRLGRALTKNPWGVQPWPREAPWRPVGVISVQKPRSWNLTTGTGKNLKDVCS